MLGTFLAGLLFYTVFLTLYSLHIFRVRESLCPTFIIAFILPSPLSLPLHVVCPLPSQNRESASHNIMVKGSLFLIQSYVSRLLIAIGAIVISAAGALVSLAECQNFESQQENTCTCTNETTWLQAVNNPSPDDRSCQFPQVWRWTD